MRRRAAKLLPFLLLVPGALPASPATAADRLRDVVAVRAQPLAPEEEWPSPPPASGERRVAVVLMSSSADAGSRWEPAESERAMFGPGPSVDAFMRSASGDRVSVAGDVHGWYTADDLGDGCDTYALADRGADLLRGDGVDLRDYHYVMVQFPRRGCPFNGLAWISDPFSLINGRPSDVRLLSHELGHNFGLTHANAVSCRQAGAPVALSGDCAYHEYGDPFSTMGHNHHLFHGMERALLGWMPPDHLVYAEREGVYMLGGPGGDAPEVLGVPRRLGGNWWETASHLALDLRTARAPFDAFEASDPAVTGIGIRLVHQYQQYLTQWPMALIDTTPGSPGGHRDAPLRAGDTFVDDRSHASVTLESLRDGLARVRVAWVPSPPSPVTARLDGDAVLVEWGASEDDRGVLAYELERDGAVVERTTGLGARHGGLPRGREIVLRVVAVDADGNRRASAPVTVSVPPLATGDRAGAGSAIAALRPAPAAPDTARPVLRLRPRPGARLGRNRRLVVLGRDDRRGLRLAVFLDGRLLRRVTGRRLVVRLPARALRGRHVLKLRAIDAAGNRRVVRLRLVGGRLT